MLNPKQKIMGWKPDGLEKLAKPSNHRPFKGRKETSFTRPPAIYSNRNHSDRINDLLSNK